MRKSRLCGISVIFFQYDEWNTSINGSFRFFWIFLLRVISWKGASFFNGGFVFQLGCASFLSGGWWWGVGGGRRHQFWWGVSKGEETLVSMYTMERNLDQRRLNDHIITKKSLSDLGIFAWICWYTMVAESKCCVVGVGRARLLNFGVGPKI